MMDNEYIRNGEVARNRIALDIKYRKIKRYQIEQLLKDPIIVASFIGLDFKNKKPMKDWNKPYLDELSYAAIAESFNEDYLFYLDEVADYISKATFKKIVIAGTIVVIVIIAGLVVYKHVIPALMTDNHYL